MIARLLRLSYLAALTLLAEMPALGAEDGAGVGAEAKDFRRAVEAAFRSADKPVTGLQCRPPDTGRGLFGAFAASEISRVLIAPVSAQAKAFNAKDHFHRFDGAVFQLSICVETPKTKEMCIVRPVRRLDGALCVE